MGCVNQPNILSGSRSRQGLLKMGSLNFSGVVTSPYEFYQKDDEEENKLYNIFSRIVSEKYPNFNSSNQKDFIWDMGTIDAKWKQRYSPANMAEAGILQGKKKMMNEKQFNDKWNQVRKQTQEWVNKNYFEIKYSDQKQRNTRRQIQYQRCRQFDFFSYQAFMEYIYGIKDLREVDVSSQKYQKKREADFSKLFLNKKEKSKSTTQQIKKLSLDVVYLQEADKQLKEDLLRVPEYFLVQEDKVDSIILLRKNLFPIQSKSRAIEQNNKFIEEYTSKTGDSKEAFLKKIRFNNDTVFQAFGKHLFVSVHLSSKKDKNQEQIKDLEEILKNLNKHFSQWSVIVGGDFNENIQKTIQNLKIESLEIFPHETNMKTVKKKRTKMQPQRHKAQKLDEATKDFFIANKSIAQSKCMLINGEAIVGSGSLLPSTQHPYDHYLITASVSI